MEMQASVATRHSRVQDQANRIQELLSSEQTSSSEFRSALEKMSPVSLKHFEHLSDMVADQAKVLSQLEMQCGGSRDEFTNLKENVSNFREYMLEVSTLVLVIIFCD